MKSRDLSEQSLVAASSQFGVSKELVEACRVERWRRSTLAGNETINVLAAYFCVVDEKQWLWLKLKHAVETDEFGNRFVRSVFSLSPTSDYSSYKLI